MEHRKETVHENVHEAEIMFTNAAAKVKLKARLDHN